jgi:lipopolysaccharide/colanic/teichoic acid biosynthesis glycosyltransferase
MRTYNSTTRDPLSEISGNPGSRNFGSTVARWAVKIANGAGWLYFVRKDIVLEYLKVAYGEKAVENTYNDEATLDNSSATYVTPGPLPRILKRTVDIGFSAIALVLLAPVLVVIVLLIRMNSPGPIVFSSARVGQRGRVFRLLKFRTMVAQPQMIMDVQAKLRQQATSFRLGNDPRITSIGRFLRKYSLDELPQLFNVLRGDLSIVGPSPLFTNERDFEANGRLRFNFKPGITGLRQIQIYNEVPQMRSSLITFDLAYLQNWSFQLDFKIVLATIIVVLTGRSVQIVQSAPRVVKRPKNFRREEQVVSQRDDEWIGLLSTVNTN